jgi:hypothetical protein
MTHEKATMVKSKAMMTQRGSILRLRIVFVSTGQEFFDFLFSRRICFAPRAPPKPRRISIPVMGTSGSGGGPGWAKATEQSPIRIVRIEKKRKKPILFPDKFNVFQTLIKFYPGNVHSCRSRNYIQRALPNILFNFLPI